MPIFEYNNTKINVPEDKIEAFKKNFPTATLFEEKEKEVEITPDTQSPSIEKPDEMMPDMDSLPGKPMGEASSVPRDDFAIDPLQTDTSDSVGPKMDTDLKSAFDKTPLGEARLATIDKVANSPDYSIGVEQQAYNRLTGKSDRPMQMLGQKEDAIAKASRQEYENYKHQKEGTRIFKEGLIPKIKELEDRISVESEEAYQSDKAKLDKLQADKPFYLKALEGLAEGDPNKATHDPFKGMEGVKTYNAASYFLNDANRIIKEAERSQADDQSGTNVGSAIRGLVDKGFSIETWNFGVNEFDRNGSILRAIQKSEAGKTLTKDEDALLDALALNLAVNDYYGSDIKRGYKWGEIAGESLPFMLEFMLNPIAGGARGMARRVAIHAIKKMGAKGAGRTAINVVTHLASDIVVGGAMAATTGVFKTAADGLNRMIGEPLYDVKEDGSIVYGGRVGGEDAVTAFMKAYGAQTIEYGSEMFGNNMMWNIMGKTKVAKGLRKQFKASGLGKVAGRMHASKAVQGLSKLEARAQWAGPIGELVEEWYGTILNATFIGDQEYKDVLDMDENLDMLAGFLITQGPMSAAKSFGYGIDRAQSNRDLKRFSSENSNHFDNWEGLKNQLADLPLLERIAIQKQMFARDDISIGAKESFGKYVAALTYNDALTGAAEGRKEVDLTAATANGQKLTNEIQDKRSIVLRSLNNEIESYRAILGDRFDMSEQELADDPQLSTDAEMQAEMIEAARKHDIAYAEYESVLNGLVTQAEEFIKPQLESIAQATRKDGTVIKSSILGEDVFVMKGDIAFNADGSMDKKNSSEYLVVKNENGDKSQVPLRHLTYAEQMTAEEMTAEVKRQAKEKFVDPFIAKLEGVTKFELGEEVSFLNDKGETIVGRVGSKTQDGVVTISTNDGKILSFTEQDLASRQVTQSAGAFNVQDEVQIDIEGESHDAQVVKIEDGKISLFIPNAPTAEGRYITVGEAELNSMLYNEAEVETEAEVEEETPTQTTRQIGNEVHTFEGDKTVKIEKRNSDGSLTQTWPAKETVETKEEVKGEVQETEEETEDKFPRKKDGRVDFESIKEPTTYKEALESEFGKEMANEIVAEELEDAKKAYQAALKSKKGSAAERAYAKRDALARVKHFEEIGSIFINEQNEARSEAELDAEKKEAERQALADKNQIGSIPDVVNDSPEDARARGYKSVNGVRVDRAKPLIIEKFKNAVRRFTTKSKDAIPVKRTIIEAKDAKPVHKDGYKNEDHFVEEAQPKNRTQGDSKASKERIAANIDVEQITEGPTAYVGAPVVNSRGEVIQGNNRTDALQAMYGGFPEQAKKYKEYLMANAEKYGMTAEEIGAMENPIAVDMAEVDDAEMIRLGQLEAADMESGGSRRIDGKRVGVRLKDRIKNFANILFKFESEDVSLRWLINKNGVELLQWLNNEGHITETQYLTAINKDGYLTEEAKIDLESIMMGVLFEGGKQSLEQQFLSLPAKAQKTIMQVIHRDMEMNEADKMKGHIQEAISAYHALASHPEFKKAKTYQDAKEAIERGAKPQTKMFDGESTQPLDGFSDFALELAAIFHTDKQTELRQRFNDYYDAIQGIVPTGLFETAEAGAKHLSKVEAISKVFNDFKLEGNDKTGSDNVAESSGKSQEGQQLEGETESGERVEVEKGEADNTEGTGADTESTEVKGPKFKANRQTVSYMAEIANLEKEFGVKATVHTSTETIGNTKARNQIEADIKGDIPMANRAKGWMVDGEVHIYLPHAESIADIYKTYIHEAIGHKGVREFLGAEKHDALMETIYGYLPTNFKDRSLAQLKEIHPEKTDLELKRLVADEFVAVLSEDAGLKVEHKNIWKKIVEAVMKALGKDKTFFQFGEAEKIALEVIGQAAQSMRERKQTETSKGDNVSFRKEALETQLSEAQKTQKEAQKRYNQAQNKHAKLSKQAAKDVLYGNKGQTDLFGAPPVGSDNLFQNEESINTGVRDILDDARKEKEGAAREVNRAAKAVEVIKEKIFNEQIGQQSLFDGEDVRFRMLGKEGAMRLDKLENSTRRLDNLSVAKKMAADNIDAKKIKRATGWETAKDGKWRYEQLDLVLAKNLTPQEKLQMKDPVHLSDMIYDEHGLFDAYPILKETRVFQMAPRSWMDVFNLGMYDSENNVIFLNAALNATNERSVLIHEVQHAIQNAEGFAQGGNLEIGKQEYIKSKYGSVEAYQERIEKIHEERNTLDSKKASIAGELAKLDTKLKRLNKNLFVFNKQEKRAPITNEIDKLSAEIESQKDKILDLSVEIREIEREVILNEDAFYNMIAGEVEARNAAKRMDMTAEERANSLLEETEDVPRKDQIVIMDNVVKSQQALFNNLSEQVPELKGLNVLTEKEADVMFRAGASPFLDVTAKHKIYKKAFGERAARVIRGKMPIAFDQIEELVPWLSKKIPIKGHTLFVLENIAPELEREFLSREEAKEDSRANPTVSVADMLKDVGYDVTKVSSVGQAESFISYYKGEGSDNRNGGSIICTYNNVGGRLRSNFMTIIVKNDAKETLRAEVLTQDNLSESWKEYLEEKGRKNEDGTFNLEGLRNHREDPFSTSVLNIQVDKQNGYLKIISRYNHTIHEGNTHPDAVYGGDLNQIVNGLEDAMYNELGVKKGEQGRGLPDNVEKDNKGRYFQYDIEQNGVISGDGFYIRNGETTLLDPNSQRMVEGWVLNQNGEMENISTDYYLPFGHEESISNIRFTGKNKIKIDTRRYGEVEFEVQGTRIKQGAKMSDEGRLNYLSNLNGFKIKPDGTYEIGSVPASDTTTPIFWSDKITSIKGMVDAPSNMTTLGNVEIIDGNMNDFGQLEDFGQLQEVTGEIILFDSKMKNLGKLKSVGKSLTIQSSDIETLGELTNVGHLSLRNVLSLRDLGKVEKVKGNLSINGTELTTLGNITSIQRELYLSNSPVKSLGKITYIGSGIHLTQNEAIQDLGDLEYAGSLDMSHTTLKSLGNLKVIGGRFLARDSQLENLGALTHISGEVDLVRSKLKNLGNVTHIGGNLSIEGSRLTSLGSLQHLNGDLNAVGSKLKDLGNLEFIAGELAINGSDVKSLGKLKSTDQSIMAQGSKLEDLGALEHIRGTGVFTSTKIKNTGNLKIVTGRLILPPNTKILNNLEFAAKVEGSKVSGVYTHDDLSDAYAKVALSNFAIHKQFVAELESSIDGAKDKAEKDRSDSNVRFRRSQHLDAIEKVVERYENTIELKENETQKEAPNLSKLVLLNNVKDYGLYDKYEIVPVSDPLVNIYNLNRSIYGLGVQLKHVKDLHNSAYLDFDGDTGKLDASKVRKFSEKFNYFIRPYETALMIAKHSATEAAQREIMDIIKDIDHAKDYYERLAKDHNVLRTEESPRFRKVEPFKYGEGGTKGIFKGKDGTLYKSLQPGVLVWKDGQGTREYLDTETQEYDILKRLDGDKRFPIIGEKVQTSEGPAFEIEPLVEVKNLTLKEYEAVEATIQELNDKGIFHNDFISVMRRDNTNEVVINDFSSGNYDPSRAKDSYWKDSLFSRLEDLLSKEDLAELKEKRAQKRLEEYQEMFPDEDLTIDDVRYRRGNMAALHNIGEEHLMEALNGKGLIAPSIGVTNVENEYSDFGAITLIAPKKMVDPTKERVKVFAGDAYTPTVPRPMYHVNEKVLDNWGRQVINKAMKISRDIANLIGSEVHDHGNFYKDLFKYSQQSVVSEYENNMDMKLAYLVDSDIGFTVPMKEKQAYLGMNFYFDMTDAERERGKYIYDRFNKETKASGSNVSEQTIQDYQSYIYGIISDRITEKYKDLDKEGREYLVPRMIDRLYSNYKDAINMGLHNLSPAFTRTREVDMKALEKRVNNKIVKRDYRAWLNNKVDEFQGTRYFIDGKEKRGYYAENILDYTTRYTRGQEKTLTYGMNKAKSYGIKELNSIPAMQELRDILIPKEEMSKIDEAYSNEYMDLSSKVDYLDGDTWDGLNALGKALSDHYKGMSPARALSKNGFDSKKGSEYFRDFAKRLKENPVDYFEAKMQRMVPISEFAAVAVPLGTSTETTKKLREAGLKVVKYDPTVEGDRQAKVEKASDKSDIRFRRDNAGFYSTVENALESVPQEKGTVNQFKAMLQKNGAKQGEMNWMDWDSFVEGKESLTKAEVQEWINDNRIEIEAVEKSSRLKVELMPGHENDWQVVNREGVVIMANMAKQNAQEYADKQGKQRTRYSDYQEPGGENYREVLLTLPNKDPFAKLFTIEADSDGNYLLLNKEGKVIEETNIKNSQIAEEHFRKKHNAVKDEYGSPHFFERNIAVHVRMNDRVDSKGNKVLFVEEIQSDWAQAGREKGYKQDESKLGLEPLLKAEELELEEGEYAYTYKKEDGASVGKGVVSSMEEAQKYLADYINERINKRNEAIKSDNRYKAVPQQPFKNTDQWVNLAIRKIMMEATEGGYDKVAWTTGEQQNERYSLSRQIDWIEYEQNENGKYQISLPIELILPSELTEQDLADTFGKEMANKIIAGEGSDTSYGTKKIEGEDLEVGGDGMKGFYNKILPSQANKLGKQFGAKVEVIEIDGLGKQLALPVTEKMIDSTDEGMPLFRRADNLMDNADNFKDNVKDYNAFLNNALNNAADKQALIDKARSEGLSSLPKVIEQYLATIDNPAELEAIKNELRVDMPDEAMRYLLWRNANPNDGSVAWRAKESMKMQELDPNVLFRRGLIPLPNAFNEYERRVRSRYNKGFKAQMFRIEEGWFDKMTSLRILQEAIAGKDIPGNQNAYQLENQLSSKNAAEIERYNKRVIEPMLQAVHKVFGNSLTDADLYLMAKHGLERNDKMAYYYAHEAFKGQKENLKAMLDSGEIGPDGYNLGMQNINSQARELYEQYKENDYSGLTEIAKQRGLDESFLEAGQNIVAEVEGRASQEDINELWARVNEANKIILKKQFDSGKMSQGEYDQIKGMYDFYVPLRGFDAKVATDYYSYLENKPSEFSSVLKKAWGRKSKADSPIATMMNMSESGFMEANRNVMKQAFLQLVQQNKSDLASVRDFWYVKDAEGNWTETFPEIPEGAMGQEVIDILDAFDERMEALGEDASRGRNSLDVGVKILPAQASEHAVRVWMGGKESIVYVNGNPRAAQAINGLIGKNHQEDGKTIMNGIRHLNRMMASNFTSNNPTFVVTNLLRDVQFAVAAGAIKEGGRYSANLALNLAKTPKTVAQNLWGQGNKANSEYQQYWDEFLMGGGETGYTQINTMDKHRKFVNSKLREFDNKVDVLSVFRGYVKQMETANRLIESNTRFATFVTSRQAGRDVQRSIADAKEITINFNRKGSGGVGASIAHNFYLFSNPAIQSARMMGLMAKNQPKAFFGALAATMSGGFLTPMMNELLLQLVGDDDDKEKYWNINPWVRRNNLVMYLPWTESKFMTIPLPHELRAFHGIGEMSYAKMTGRMRHENMAKEVIGQFSNMLPMDMAGEHDWFVPDFLKPIEQGFWSNKNFMNRPIYKKTPWNERDPEWTKAYKNTPEMLIDFSKWTNERSGGDDVKKGKADVKLNNPAVLNTLAQGYFGGALTMYTDIADLAYKLLTKEEVSVRDVPFVNKVVRESGSDVRNQNIYSEYSIYKEWYKDFKHDLDGYNKLRRDNPLYQNKYREMKAMPEYKTFKLMDRRIKAIEKLRDKNPERYEQKLEEFIEEMHMIEDGY